MTSIQIDGVQHEFTTIPGVKEDVTEIILNFKELALKLFCDGEKRLEINAEGPCELTAADIRVYVSDAPTVAEALARFNAGKLAALKDADVEGHWV